MLDFLFDHRGFIVGLIFLGMIAACVWAILYGRNLIRTEKSDAVFGDPARAEGPLSWPLAAEFCFGSPWLTLSRGLP